MPKILIGGAMEYEEGTSATKAQMGKDMFFHGQPNMKWKKRG